ncbi:MAG: PIN domain-containing protein [Gammaproteobacteria bacterium]|nr:PIN domain-containing protein [Gammaproteobacteria bacterium]
MIYAYDLDAANKRDRAVAVVKDLWETESGIISTQVLKEFYVNVIQKIPTPLSRAKARGVLNAYVVWPMETIRPDTIMLASEFQERHQLSFWDAMIVIAAVQGGAEIPMSEDLNHGQIIEGIRIENPFMT